MYLLENISKRKLAIGKHVEKTNQSTVTSTDKLSFSWNLGVEQGDSLTYTFQTAE